MSIWLVVGVLVVVGCVLVVALPFLRRPGLSAAEDRLDEPDALERRRLELSEERDRALAALKELEFDHRTGKISDEDYRALVGPLRRRAAETLRALEPAAKRPVRDSGPVEGDASAERVGGSPGDKNAVSDRVDVASGMPNAPAGDDGTSRGDR